MSKNFLSRNAVRFAEKGNLVVIVDMPDDIKRKFVYSNSKLLGSAYRISEKHVSDIKALLSKLTKIYGIREFFLIGTSRGTISVAYLANKFPNVKGVILTATLASDPHFSACCKDEDFLKCTNFEKTDKKVLFIHHKLDGCISSAYSYAYDTFKKLKAKSKEFRRL